MNIIQTYYSYSTTENPIHDKAGFLSPDMNWKSMALSCLLLKKHFGKVSLYCNGKVLPLLRDEFRLPYDEFIEIPEFMDEYKGCELWALPKIYTYSQQQEPFIHVDTDWFMFDKLPESVINADIIGQNIEYDGQMCNRRMLERLISENCEFDSCVLEEYNREPVLRLINAGILGGNDMELIHRYIKMIRTFIKQNKDKLRFISDGYVNMIYEQLFLYLLAKRENKQIGVCTEGDKLSTTFEWLPLDFYIGPKSQYMHLLAGIKRKLKPYAFVTKYLDYLDSDLHERITRICYDNGIAPMLSFPKWGIYSQSYSPKPGILVPSDLPNRQLIDISMCEKVIRSLENSLSNKSIQLASERERGTKALWNIKSLWGNNVRFIINPKIYFAEVNDINELSQLCNVNSINISSAAIDNENGSKMLLVLVADTDLMKVVKFVFHDVKAAILDIMYQQHENTNIENLSHELSKKSNIAFDSDDERVLLDRIIRTLIDCNVIHLSYQ